MDVSVGVFSPELDEKYVFKYAVSDGSQVEGIMIYVGCQKIGFK